MIVNYYNIIIITIIITIRIILEVRFFMIIFCFILKQVTMP